MNLVMGRQTDRQVRNEELAGKKVKGDYGIEDC